MLMLLLHKITLNVHRIMVRTYKKKGDGPKWSQENLANAISDHKSNKLSIYIWQPRDMVYLIQLFDDTYNYVIRHHKKG